MPSPKKLRKIGDKEQTSQKFSFKSRQQQAKDQSQELSLDDKIGDKVRNFGGSRRSLTDKELQKMGSVVSNSSAKNQLQKSPEKTKKPEIKF